jgi:hypothetical protein
MARKARIRKSTDTHDENGEYNPLVKPDRDAAIGGPFRHEQTVDQSGDNESFEGKRE